MSWGDDLNAAWNTASDSAHQAVGAIATSVSDAAEWTGETASDAAEWTTNKVVETGEWVDKKTNDVIEWGEETSEQVKDWSVETYIKTSDAVDQAYQSTKETFNDTVAAANTIICKEALAAENFFYVDVAGRAVSWAGEGQRLFAEENVDVKFSDENFEKWTGGLSIEETQILYEDETGKIISYETIKTLFTSPEQSRELLVQDKDIHTIYRDILNTNIPMTIDEAINNDNWIELSKFQTLFHGSVTHKNRKFISKDGYREVILSPDGSIDKRNEFKGTFNFFSPTDNPNSHILADVDPYVKYGN